MSFFEKHYPDSIGLIGGERLCRDFFATEPSMLISIKASDGEGCTVRFCQGCVITRLQGQKMRIGYPLFCVLLILTLRIEFAPLIFTEYLDYWTMT